MQHLTALASWSYALRVAVNEIDCHYRAHGAPRSSPSDPATTVLNTLARQLPTSAGPSSSEVGEESRVVPGGVSAPDRAPLFILGSVLLHVALATVIAIRPAAAKTSTPSADEIEISFTAFEEPKVPAPEVERAPLGDLEAPLESVSSFAKPQPSRVQTAQPQTAQPQTALASAQTAPEILAEESPSVGPSDNPYAQGTPDVFTSGVSTSNVSATAAKTTVSAAAHKTGFGVKNGQADASAAQREALEVWYQSVRSKLAQVAARAYPRRAQRLGQQGTTRVSVRINPQGHVTSATVAGPSGFNSLDEAAVGGIRAVGQVPTPPAGTGTQTLTIPITFRLR